MDDGRVEKKRKGREIGLVRRVKERRRRERPRGREERRGEGRAEDWEEVSGPLLGGRDQKEEKMKTGGEDGGGGVGTMRRYCCKMKAPERVSRGSSSY